MRMSRFVLTVSVVCMAFAVQANAAAYKCVGNNGKVEYRDVPCASSQRVEKTFDQQLGSSQPVAARVGESSRLAPGAASTDDLARQAVAQAEPNTQAGVPANPRPAAGSPAPADARSDNALGGLCSGNISWDNCRKLGIDSIVDCKRMDEDTVYRVSVLESKGVQCRTRPVRTR